MTPNASVRGDCFAKLQEATGVLAVSPRKPRSHTARSGQEPCTSGGSKSVLRVGGEPGKTAGPTLRGAARSRTLQEGARVCCGLAVSPGNPTL